ncbi:calcium-binding protein [uncultured Nostoc sp.]|uniref:calcium-binding protein n=1 Tax=uncultured Nostoc sp. TaxID=340711 RepID=UPI0035CAA0D2
MNEIENISDAITVTLENPQSYTVIITGHDQLTNVENLVGSRFNDELTGDSKDNVINPGLPAIGAVKNFQYGFNFDIVDGGAGKDLLVVDYSSIDPAIITGGINGSLDNFNGSGVRFINIEYVQITGSNKDDVIYGLMGGDDTLNGMGGNDILIGGSNNSNDSNNGNDVINGGDGNDEISNRNYNAAGDDTDLFDRFDGGAGDDILSANFSNQTADITFISGQSNNIVFADGTYAKNFEYLRNFTSGSGNDTIIQKGRLSGGFNFNSSIENRFFTSAGDDTIDSGLGVDSVDAGEGNDLLIIDYSDGDNATTPGLNGSAYGSSLSSNASYNRHNIDYSQYDSIIAYNIERYKITGTSKADSFTGWFGDDVLIGGAGNDTINAFYGNDFVDAGSGDDEVGASFDLGHYSNPFDDSGKLDKLDGGTGIDTLTAAFGNQTADINFNSANPTDILFNDGTYAKNFEVIRNLETGSGNDNITQLGRINNRFVFFWFFST